MSDPTVAMSQCHQATLKGSLNSRKTLPAHTRRKGAPGTNQRHLISSLPARQTLHYARGASRQTGSVIFVTKFSTESAIRSLPPRSRAITVRWLQVGHWRWLRWADRTISRGSKAARESSLTRAASWSSTATTSIGLHDGSQPFSIMAPPAGERQIAMDVETWHKLIGSGRRGPPRCTWAAPHATSG